MTDVETPTGITTLLTDVLPSTWNDDSTRANIIESVGSEFLLNTDGAQSTDERRRRAQQQAADNENVELSSIEAMCGEALFSWDGETNDYQESYFDPALSLLEEALDGGLLHADTDTDVFVIPVSERWLEQFERTVDSPIVLGPPAERPRELTPFRAVRIWGTTIGDRNQATHDNLDAGDIVLFSHDASIFAMGRVQKTIVSKPADEFIWDNEDSRYIYTLVGYQRVQLPKAKLWTDLVYSPNFTMRGFKRIADQRVDNLRELGGGLDASFEDVVHSKTLSEYLSADSLESTQTALDDQSDEESSSTTSDAVSPTAPYYWVNQKDESELEDGYLQAPVNQRWEHDLGKLEVGDEIFNFTDGAVLGYSKVASEPAMFTDEEGEEHWRVELSVSRFNMPLPLHEILGGLLAEHRQLEEYYPVNKSGINQGYLFNLSEEAGEYIIAQAKSRGGYNSLSEAEAIHQAAVHDLIGESVWLQTILIEPTIKEWTAVLRRNDFVEKEVRPTDYPILEEITDTFESHQSKFEEIAERLNAGGLMDCSPAELVYILCIRELQRTVGVPDSRVNLNHVKWPNIRSETYRDDDELPEADQIPEDSPELARQLQAKGQLVFHGPPGTRKTYTALNSGGGGCSSKLIEHPTPTSWKQSPSIPHLSMRISSRG